MSTPDVGRQRRADGDPTRPLRIALLTYRGNPRCGGQGVYARHLSRALVALGHHVTVFSGQPYPELDPGVELFAVPSLDLYRDADPFRRPRRRELASLADVAELATMWTGGFAEPRTFSWRVRDALLARGGDFDVVHDNQCLGTGVTDLLEAGWPVVASIHHPVTIDREIDLAGAGGPLRRLSLRRWYGFAAMQTRTARRIDRVITVSQASADDIVRELGVARQRLAVVPLGVDTELFVTPTPERAGRGRVADRILATMSADVALKGLVHLLEALAKLRTEFPTAHLVVVGSPRRDGAVAGTIERLSLQDAVRFTGPVSDGELVALQHEASCVVVASLYEGFSLPAIEAMACGTPLVATTGGALPEVAGPDGEAALLVAPGDPDALAQAVRRLWREEGLAERLGAAGAERVRRRYTWEETARATVEQYRAAIAHRAC